MKLKADTISHHILYVVILLVHGLLVKVSNIIPKNVVVGLDHGLNTIQRSGLLCFVIRNDIVHQRECPQIRFLASGYFICTSSKNSIDFSTRPSNQFTQSTI